MWPFIISFLISTLAAPLVIQWYRRRHWVDDPATHRHVKVTHQQPVPRGGGLVVAAGIVLTSLLLLPIDSYLLAIMASTVLLTVTGILDDIYDIHPGWRLAAGLLAALIVVGAGIGIAYVSNPFGPGVIHLDQPVWQLQILGETRSVWVLADLFAIVFIVWNMNIVNWSKGVDGQLPGFVGIALVFVGILSYRFIDDPTSFNTAHLAFIVAGAFFGLLVWNFYPQKIMPGYGAGSLAGFYLSVLAILSGAKVATTLMVIAIPTADAIFTIARRIRAGKSPLWGDRGHLHHKLMDVLGWGKRRVAVFYWSASLVLGILSLYLNTMGKLLTIGLTFAIVFGFLSWAKWVSVYGKQKST